MEGLWCAMRENDGGRRSLGDEKDAELFLEGLEFGGGGGVVEKGKMTERKRLEWKPR